MKSVIVCDEQHSYRSQTLTWLIFEVEDGHYVIRKIKDGEHSHFGESLGKIAHIKNCQYVFHRASPMSSGSLLFFALFQLLSLEWKPP